MELHELVKPLGILTYVVIAVTVFSGVRHWKLPYHKWLAAACVLVATLHALLVMFAEH